MLITAKFVFLHFSKLEVGYERVKADSSKLRTRRSACVGARDGTSRRAHRVQVN